MLSLGKYRLTLIVIGSFSPYPHERSVPRTKIDLTTVFKPQSNPARSAGDGRSQSHVEQDIRPFRSGSVHSNSNLTFAPRTTASSGIVVSKPSSKAVGKQKKKEESPVPDSEPDAHGGLSAEDDSLEKEVALSSLMKGGELRATKVWHLFSVLLVTASFCLVSGQGQGRTI